jgi:hypothetical protein
MARPADPWRKFVEISEQPPAGAGRDDRCATEGVGERFEDGDRPAKIELTSGKAETLPAPVLREMVRRVCSPSRGLTCTSENGASLSESLGPTCMPVLTARFREA